MAQVKLTDHELLTKYELLDPLNDAYLFARLVDQVAYKRRANLHATITYKQGEFVTLTWAIDGYDSQGEALHVQSDRSSGALADLLRLLNQRYAALLRAQNR